MTATTTSSICPSWTLHAWPPLLWQLGSKSSLQLQHLGTHVTTCRDGSDSAIVGQTIWAGHSHDGDAGMAWDWIQLTEGVFAMVDPMAVITNLRLVTPAGEVLTALESAVHLNQIVHSLPWQDEVGRALCEVLN